MRSLLVLILLLSPLSSAFPRPATPFQLIKRKALSNIAPPQSTPLSSPTASPKILQSPTAPLTLSNLPHSLLIRHSTLLSDRRIAALRSLAQSTLSSQTYTTKSLPIITSRRLAKSIILVGIAPKPVILDSNAHSIPLTRPANLLATAELSFCEFKGTRLGAERGDSVAYLSEVVVNPLVRGRGIAKAMVKAASETARDSGECKNKRGAREQAGRTRWLLR